MRYLMFFMVMMFSNVSQAMNCQNLPDCESLGYSKSEDSNCVEDGYMYCPFDQDYKVCVQYNCAALGFTTSDKTSWCDEIVTCKDDASYTLCNHLKPEPVSCEVGDVYYADGSCGDVSKYTEDSGKTPVGVVYYISDGGAHGKVINLHDLGKASSYAEFDQTKRKNFQWGAYNKGISGVTNWECSGSDNYLTVAATGEHSNPFWSAGKSYTETIAKAQSNNLEYAAPATLAFYPPGVNQNDLLVGQGKWYLPTLGELMDLYGYDYNNVTKCQSTDGANGNTKQKVNATLQALKDKSAGNAETLTEDYYWSSSESTSYYSWYLYMSNGDRNYNHKIRYYYVRTSLQF